MMMQQQQQQQTRRGAGLAAAFGFEKPSSSQQQRQALTKQAGPMPQQQQKEQPAEIQQQQQIQEQQQQQQTTKTYKSEAAEFLDKHNVPTFVPVYASTADIEPKINESAKGQVPWKCAHCHAHSFGHHCMSCVRHRDQAALRIFIGQLCKEGAPQMVEKMVETLLPDLSQPHLYIEQHTDARTGHGKGCVWLYVHSVQDIVYAVKALNKRTFLTVEESSGNVGFVAFPTSFTNQEIEQAFQLDHEAQDDHVKSLFMFTVVSAQVPKNLQGMIAAFTGKGVPANNKNFVRGNNNFNHHQQPQQQQMFMPPPPPPTYGSSLPPPPAFNKAGGNYQQQQFQQFGARMQQQQIPDISCSPQMDNRQIEEAQQQQQQPNAFLGQQQPVNNNSQYTYRQQNQTYSASWNTQCTDDNNFGGYY